MRKLVVSEFVTMDGVMEDPGGSEGFERGGWAFKFDRGPEGDKFKLDELMASDALLLGRITYEGFAAAWPSRTGEFAEKMNNMTKYVVSSSMQHADWNNSTLIKGHIMEEVTSLKSLPGQDILVAGSGWLVHTLVQYALIDELRLMVFPVVLGKGKRLFNDGSGMHAFQLVEAKPVGSSVLTLIYHLDRK
jgi:dihydrofolate reductase